MQTTFPRDCQLETHVELQEKMHPLEARAQQLEQCISPGLRKRSARSWSQGEKVQTRSTSLEKGKPQQVRAVLVDLARWTMPWWPGASWTWSVSHPPPPYRIDHAWWGMNGGPAQRTLWGVQNELHGRECIPQAARGCKMTRRTELNTEGTPQPESRGYLERKL
jgi:hypothetical protein